MGSTVMGVLGILGILAVALLPVSVDAKRVKTEVCHKRGDGTFVLKKVPYKALPAHFKHGDAMPGDPLPISCGFEFNQNCEGVAIVPISRISVDQAGGEANGRSRDVALSRNGRFVVYNSDATDLVAGDTNDTTDVFVTDRLTGITKRVNVSPSGEQADSGELGSVAISADGRYVVFQSAATNLVPGATLFRHIYLHDLLRGTTALVSVDSAGAPASGNSMAPNISANGRYLAFISEASNLVLNDTNGTDDVFVHDTAKGTTTRVSISSDGVEANGNSGEGVRRAPALSANGRFITFFSAADNLVDNDINGQTDVFVRDMRRNITTMASVGGTGGSRPNSLMSDISADGRFVAFVSQATNLVPDDTNGRYDVFVRDNWLGTTERVSVDLNGEQGFGHSGGATPSISADGRFVAFLSFAVLAPSDINGTGDIYVRDRALRRTIHVSTDVNGLGADFTSNEVAVSADGRYAGFASYATNLVPDDGNNDYDIFLRSLVLP